jgi:hypothetical protein
MELISKYTCKFSLDNEYVKRMINADNGLFESMLAMKKGNVSLYNEYFTKITNGEICSEERTDFWAKQVTDHFTEISFLDSEHPSVALNGVHSSKSMNVDHTKLFYGDPFLIDGNHRITSSLVRGEEPIVILDHRNIGSEWGSVLEAKTDTNYRIKHHPHPHPILWDLKSYRTMESCESRYVALADAGIKSTYEIGCAEGVGVWLLREKGIDARGSEINSTARTLARSLTKINIDEGATPSTVPDSECIILYSVLYHLLSNPSKAEEWIARIKEFPCVALELSTEKENLEKERYRHMTEYNPLEWWPNKKLIYVDKKQANRETWLLWK